jgi:protein-S-isoprenylcysteine O-methyltransferase
MFTTVCAYVLIVLFLVVERRLRQGKEAASLEAGAFDRGSTRYIGYAFAVTFGMLLLAPVLNLLEVASINAPAVGWIGLVLMIVGLALRYWASVTLGAFYTRTLLVKSDHHMVDTGPYRLIRNPGYLGDIVLFIGGGLAVLNWLAAITIGVVILAAYVYRIRVEETMLVSALGEPYKTYMTHTWRLIPLIY